MNNKHILIYYQFRTGTYVVTEPMPWSRENQHLFPQHNFINNNPTSNEIGTFLEREFDFSISFYNDSNITLISNLDPILRFPGEN